MQRDAAPETPLECDIEIGRSDTPDYPVTLRSPGGDAEGVFRMTFDTSHELRADYSKREHDRAIADKSRAIALDPTNSEFYYSRGLTHKVMKNTAAARRDFQRATDLGYTAAEAELKKLSG